MTVVVLNLEMIDFQVVSKFGLNKYVVAKSIFHRKTASIIAHKMLEVRRFFYTFSWI